jgi:NTP pyrophosphatase (non-canonical NTP hydrolase)
MNQRKPPGRDEQPPVDRKSVPAQGSDQPQAVEPRTDEQTTVAELRDALRRFVDERQWRPYHTPKNLAMALAVEAAELMEHFQWLTPEEALAVPCQPDKSAAVGEEIADVIGYALALANELEIDVASTIRAKMAKNEQKYPAEKYRGRYEKPVE